MSLAQPKGILARLEYCTNLPTPPGVAIRIIELNKQADISTRDVVETIKLDPALSAKLIRMANSPLYARRHKTENLRQAVIHFGPYNALTLALSFSLTSNLARRSENSLRYPLFWRRSLATALASQLLGERLSSEESHEFFLPGLLQDIGMLVLDCGDDDLYDGTEVIQASHAALFQHERTRIGTDHAAVGAWILERWNFPPVLVDSVRGSHDPLHVEMPAEHLLFARVVHVGSAIAEVLCQEDAEAGVAMALERAHACLDMDKAAVMPVIDKVINDIQVMADVFELNIGDANLLGTISDKAGELMMLRNIESINEARELKKVNTSLKNQTFELEEERRRDHLTQIFNRRHLDEVVVQKFNETKTAGGSLSLAFIDIDHFKHINDKYGHHIGDEALKAVAYTLQREVRGDDEVFRYGGEEFVIVLPETDHAGAACVCTRIRDVFHKSTFNIFADIELSLRVSIGVATLDENAEFSDAEDLLRAADKAVYAAKFGGRDTIVYYGLDMDGSSSGPQQGRDQ